MLLFQGKDYVEIGAIQIKHDTGQCHQMTQGEGY
jgi:hypothetical protein